ncbi:MAG: DNA cytosine methyltransferase [Candidatus Aureabacteria bacterium]|nr:DNA cytosine methyltransferase [Candidatus Auribacterota bacterium]
MKAISLFSGAGGMDIGFIKAGIKVIWAIDKDKDSVETYRKNIDDHIVCDDIHNLQIKAIPDADVIFGGPACQGFSIAGKMNVNDPRNILIWNFFKIVKEKKPKVFIMENVKNLVKNRRFVQIKNSLISEYEKIGYDLIVKILNSKNYGVPQSRERVIFIGINKNNSLRTFDFRSLFKQNKREISVKEALLNLYKKKVSLDGSIAKVVIANRPVLRNTPYSGMILNGSGRPVDISKPSPTLTATMGGNRTPVIDGHYLLGKKKSDWFKYCHNSLKLGKKVTKVPSYIRRLTVAEVATLQTFPVSYKFSGSTSSKYRQIGNAVPPLMAKEIATCLMR